MTGVIQQMVFAMLVLGTIVLIIDMFIGGPRS